MRKLLLIGVLSIVGLTACQSTAEDTQVAKENASKDSNITEKDTPDEETQDQGEQEQGGQTESEGSSSNDPASSEEEPGGDKTGNSVVVVNKPTSTEVVVNKHRKLPDGYTPPNLTVPDVPFYFEEFHQKKQLREVAAQALEELFAGAEEAGIDLVAASGYRSYDRQEAIFASNVQQHGEEHAKQFSAMAGHSEHQTGLAMDVTIAKLSFKLSQQLGDLKEGEWLAEHAHTYGFVVRYPEGKTDITGYEYEPWHLRYVGKEVATEVYNQGVTLEEYYQLVP